MPLDIARIQALCFDVDGTLRDTDDQYVDRLTQWLHPVRFLFTHHNPQTFARRVIMASESPGAFIYSLPDRLGIDNHLTALVAFMYRIGMTRRPDVFWIVRDVYEAVRTLSACYPMAIISARDERTTFSFLQQFKLLPLFHSVATAHTCQRTKPYPDPILWAAAQMGVAPSACLMIGDTTVDMRAGRAAGAQTVGVLCGFGHEGELRHAGADLILPSPADLPGVLLNTGNRVDGTHPCPHERMKTAGN